jgi:hypothetical protein
MEEGETEKEEEKWGTKKGGVTANSIMFVAVSTYESDSSLLTFRACKNANNWTLFTAETNK